MLPLIPLAERSVTVGKPEQTLRPIRSIAARFGRSHA
jgi:hypothetical protein